MARSLTSYSIEELGELETQAAALLASIREEIEARRTLASLDYAATVCGYTHDGSLIDATMQHHFARVRSGRR